MLVVNGPIGATAGPRPVHSGELTEAFPGMDNVAAIGPMESGLTLLFEGEPAVGGDLDGDPDGDPALLFPAGAETLPAVGTTGALSEPVPNVGGEGGPIVVKFAQAIFVIFA